MTAALLDSIPMDRRVHADAALQAAFGAAPLEALTPMLGGASALTYRVVVGGRPHLLRLEARRDFFRDPARNYPNMIAAAQAGLAPAIRHADIAAGVAIMEFIEQKPLTAHPGGAEGMLRDLGELAARVHALPAFTPLADYMGLIGGMVARLRGSPAFAPGLLDAHFDGFDAIRAAYPKDVGPAVASHNDPNPRNILYDGHRLWLVDWELSFANDPMVDVAIMSNETTATSEQRDILLAAAFGRQPDAMLRARLLLMRQASQMFYACIMLTALALAPRETPESDLTAPTPDEFRQGVLDGRIKVGAPETAVIFGKMILAAYRAGLDCPRFKDALDLARRS